MAADFRYIFDSFCAHLLQDSGVQDSGVHFSGVSWEVKIPKLVAARVQLEAMTPLKILKKGVGNEHRAWRCCR